jgi:hypothetical protein
MFRNFSVEAVLLAFSVITEPQEENSVRVRWVLPSDVNGTKQRVGMEAAMEGEAFAKGSEEKKRAES